MHRTRASRPHPPKPWEDAYGKQGALWRGVREGSAESVEALSLAAGGTVVEIGCGDGKGLSHLVAHHRGRVVGLDLSRRALRLARGRPGAGRSSLLVQGDARHIPLRDGSAAAVFLVHVIDHLAEPDRRAALAEAWRVLAPGRGLVVETFGEGDLREGKGDAESEARSWRRGNGILYHYFEPGQVAALLGVPATRERRHARPVRFARGERVVLHHLFVKPG